MISLIKLEGVPEYSVSYIALNNQLSEVFSDLSSQPSLPLSDHSNLKIVVKSPTDKHLGSVTIHTSLLSPDIPQWLPLSQHSNPLKTLPEKTHPPRILVLYCTEHLPAVIEVTENSSNECCNAEEHFWTVHERNNFLRERVAELELNIIEKKWEYLQGAHEKFHFNQDVCEGIGAELEKMRLKTEGFEVIRKELEGRSQSLEVLYKQERYQREYLEKQIVKITQDFEELLQVESRKVSEYRNENCVLGEKVKILQGKLNEVGLKLKECEFERDEAKKFGVVGKNLSYGCEKCKILQVLQEKFEDSEFQRKILKEKIDELLEVKFSMKTGKSSEKCSMLVEEFAKFREGQIKLTGKVNELEAELESKTFDLLKLSRAPDLTEQLQQKDEKISNLLQTLQEKEQKNSELVSNLQSKDSDLKTSQIFSENITKAKEGLENTVELLTEQIKILSEKLAACKQQNFELSIQEKEKPVNRSKLTSDNADERFSEYIKNYGVEHHFERVAEGVYSFGSKKVSITLKNGSLVCRVGGGYMMIEEFLKLFVGRDSEYEEEGQKKHITTLLSPGNYSSRNPLRRFECESEGSLTERGFEYEYNYSNPINGLKENTENSPSWHKLSPTNKQRSFTPLRKSLKKRIFK